MIPILFDADEQRFETNGLGPITDAASCEVTEEANGLFELKLTLPVSSRRFPDIAYRRLILAAPNPYDRPQPFRIYRIQKASKTLTEVFARHISYDTAGLPCGPLAASSAAQAANLLNAGQLLTSPFTISTDIVSDAPFASTVPKATRALILGRSESLVTTYGGELAFDRFAIRLLAQRGADRGVRVAYGVNLIDIRQEQSIAELYTGVLPYWSSGDAVVTGDVQNAPGSFDFQNVLPVDVSGDFSEEPTKAAVNEAGQRYIVNNKVGVPKVSFALKILPPGAAGRTATPVKLWDTIHVDYPRLEIEDVPARICKTVYDVLHDRYKSLDVGDPRVTIAQTIAAPIGPDKIADAAITGQKLARGSVGGGALKNGSVTTNKIADAAVDHDKLYQKAVKADNIDDGAVGQNQLAALAVATRHVQDSAILQAKIAAGAVVAEKLGEASVVNSKLGAGAVSYGKTNFTGTLDQVGVNKSNIETINGYFTGSANFNRLDASNIWLQGAQLVLGSITIAGETRNCVTYSRY